MCSSDLDPVRFFDTSHGDISSVEGAHTFTARREYRTANARVTDYGYGNPPAPVSAQGPGVTPGVGEQVFFGEDNQRSADPVSQLARARGGIHAALFDGVERGPEGTGRRFARFARTVVAAGGEVRYSDGGLDVPYLWLIAWRGGEGVAKLPPILSRGAR